MIPRSPEWEKRERNARTVARWNGRLMLYVLAPIVLLGPWLGPAQAYRWWHPLVAWLTAAGIALFSFYWIRWGKQSPLRWR